MRWWREGVECMLSKRRNPYTSNVLIKLLAACYRFCLSLRYRVTLQNADLLKTRVPLLILPNHQALVDPQILFTQIFRYRLASPVMTELYYRLPFLTYVFRIMHAVPVPVVSAAQHDRHQFEHLFHNVLDALRKGQSVVLYPSGQLAGQGREAILGKQSAYAVISHLPENARVVTVTIRGLWGSMWSKAWTGKTPPFVWTFVKAIFYVLANGIFFCPRRLVGLSFRDVTEAARKSCHSGQKALNQYLESVYNGEGEEPAIYLKHFFYVSQLRRPPPAHVEGSVAEFERGNSFTGGRIEEKVLKFTQLTIAQLAEVQAELISLESNLVLDLNFDSLRLAEVVAVLRKEFPHASGSSLSSLKTVADLCLMAQGQLTGAQELPPCTFEEKVSWSLPAIHPEKTILDHALAMFTRLPGARCSYDTMIGTSSRRSFLIKAIVIAHILRRRIASRHIGIMLPALQSTSMLIFATYLSRKVPVMFNWTVGERAMRHCMETVGVKTILTVKSFFSLVEDQIPPELHNRFLFLDEEIKRVSPWQKLWGLLLSFVARFTFPRGRSDDTAVVLFTSGSEALPKSVPLTHRNILADLRGTLALFPLSPHERVLGFLPPFHSFGFTVTTILPLISGMRIAYTPNPTDARSILALLAHTKATLMAATPTFLKLILANAAREELSSLQTVVIGAEKCGNDVRVLFREKAPAHARILEGYGITECAPIVSINPPERPREGSVGVFIEGVEGCIASLETKKVLPPHVEGMIYVRGANIFHGYLDKELESPFEEVEGKMYYRTGDLGFLDEGGYLTITGRLKRFIKIAGEMISLPFIETLLLEKYGCPEEVVLAVEGSDAVDPPVIVLFATHPIDRGEANAHLRARGASPLIQISSVHLIETIPVLGTGKVDYKILKQQIH